MQIKQALRLLLITFSFTFTYNCFAHGDLSERIRNLSNTIIEHPDSVSLYHQRGVLYTQHGDFNLAFIDLNYCRKLNYTNPAFSLDLATVLYQLKKYNEALTEVDEILCFHTNQTEALRLKGKIFLQQKKYTDAAHLFEEVIQGNAKPKPENYIEAAKAWQRSNHINAHCKAQQILEKGISTLNGLIVLKKELIKLHLKNDDLLEAIAIQTKILNNLNRKEHAYYQLALMKKEANLINSAKADLQSAKQAIQHLPNRLLSTKAIQTLNQNINQILHNL